MAINLTKVLSQIETRHAAIDSNTDATEHTRLDAINDRINSMGGVLTYRSTGHLPEMVDSGYVGTIAYVTVDNVFGDSSGAFYMGTFKDSNWVRVATLQDSDEAAIPEPGGGGGGTPAYQGTQYGYSVAGASQDATDRYSFTSDGNSTDIITFTDERQGMTGGQGTTKGYVTGGYYAPTRRNDIYSFPFANADAWTDTTYSSTTSQYRAQKEAVGPPDRSTCYVFGGNAPTGNQNVIEKFGTEGSEANATDVGDLQAVNSQGAGQSSPTHGYLAGGATPTITNMIQKVAFATDGNSTDVSNLDTTLYLISGTSSTENGYVAGGRSPSIPTGRNLIQKHPFASDANSTDTSADLTAAYYNNTGTSSTTHGYSAGGYRGTAPAGNTNAIEKYSFSADDNATDVGDLTVGRQWAAGLQN